MPDVYLSIGSNQADPLLNVKTAVKKISEQDGVDLFGRGCFYKTEPVGEKDQEWFVNTAVAVKTEMAPEELLDKIRSIEKAMGRQVKKKWGPRVIDIDIIFFDAIKVKSKKLTIPHPRAVERRFTLQPIADINPDIVHPSYGKTVSQLLAALPKAGQEIRKLDA